MFSPLFSFEKHGVLYKKTSRFSYIWPFSVSGSQPTACFWLSQETSPLSPSISERGRMHGRMNYKDTEPYMSAFLENWPVNRLCGIVRYNHLWLVFSNELLNCCPHGRRNYTVLLPLYLFYDLPPPLPKLNVQHIQTVCVCGGAGGVELCCGPFSAGVLHSVWPDSEPIPNWSTTPNKMTSEDDIKGLVSLKFLRPWARGLNLSRWESANPSKHVHIFELFIQRNYQWFPSLLALERWKWVCKNVESKTVRKVQNEGTTSFTFKEKCSPYRRQRPRGMTSLESMKLWTLNYHYQALCVAGGGYGRRGGCVGMTMNW